MRTCTNCGGEMQELKSRTLEDVEYSYYRCEKCNEEIVDMQQLHNVAEQYRQLKRYQVKLSKWGLSLGLRIPKQLVEKYRLRDNEEVAIVPEKKGIKIIPI